MGFRTVKQGFPPPARFTLACALFLTSECAASVCRDAARGIRVAKPPDSSNPLVPLLHPTALLRQPVARVDRAPSCVLAPPRWRSWVARRAYSVAFPQRETRAGSWPGFFLEEIGGAPAAGC